MIAENIFSNDLYFRIVLDLQMIDDITEPDLWSGQISHDR